MPLLRGELQGHGRRRRVPADAAAAHKAAATADAPFDASVQNEAALSKRVAELERELDESVEAALIADDQAIGFRIRLGAAEGGLRRYGREAEELRNELRRVNDVMGSKLREIMAMTGMSRAAYWLMSWGWNMLLYLTQMFLFLLVAFAVPFDIISTHSFGVSFLLFLLYGMALNSFACFCSTLFSNVRTASVFAVALLILVIFCAFATCTMAMEALLWRRRYYYYGYKCYYWYDRHDGDGGGAVHAPRPDCASSEVGRK